MPDAHFLFKRNGSTLLLLAAVVGLLVAAIQTTQAQTFTVLYSFCSQANCADGASPTDALVEDGSGNLYGTAEYGGGGKVGTVFEFTTTGTFKVLHTFTGGADGQYPSGLVFDTKGNLYGTTLQGGTTNNGVVYEITSSGTEKVLYSFTGLNDGGYPAGPLVLDGAGNLYGVTSDGGPYECFEEYGCGTVFELSPSGVETTLWAFTGGADDGNPYAGVVRDAQGNLYGTTGQSGDFGPFPGTVFKLTPAGVETQLYSFTGEKDGSGPEAALLRDAAGNIYGTTYYGGVESCYDEMQNGCGVVFEITSKGKEKTVHRFTGKKPGGYPTTGVVEDAAGNLYGTTPYGGNNQACSNYTANGCGVIYEIQKVGGKEVVLYTFTGGADGKYPAGALLPDGKGNFYGTNTQGGAGLNGVLFKLVP
jgi:uncharacterized repeat protein (TIGR03803 family)